MPFDVATRGALAGASVSGARPAYLCEAGRAGLFMFDPANLATKVAADTAQGVYIPPATAPSGASGAWVRQFDGALRLEWFGAVPGDYASGAGSDCLAAWNAAMAYLASIRRNNFTTYFGATEIHLAGAQYFFSDTIQLKSTVRLRGMGSGYSGGASTILRFAAGKAGIVVNRFNTLGDASGSGADHGGRRVDHRGMLHPERQFRRGRHPRPAEVGDPLARAGGDPRLSDRRLPGGGRVPVGRHVGRGQRPVSWQHQQLAARQRARAGEQGRWLLLLRWRRERRSGDDVRRIAKRAATGSPTRRFLGNSWIGCHTDACGMYQIAGTSETSVVSHAGIRYYLVHGQDALGASTTPGTNAAVWMAMGAGGVHPNIPAWGTVGALYVSGGSYLQTGTANKCVFNGDYFEGGQAPPADAWRGAGQRWLHGRRLAQWRGARLRQRRQRQPEPAPVHAADHL